MKHGTSDWNIVGMFVIKITADSRTGSKFRGHNKVTGT